MQCELVQKRLALNEITPDIRDAVNAHIASCDGCRRAALLYTSISDALAREPTWRPPAGFAFQVATVVVLVPGTSRARKRFAAVAAAALLLAAYLLVNGSLLHVLSVLFEAYVSVVSVISRAIVTNAVFLVWVSATISVVATVWLARRWLAEG
jgi:anti-sigma factor RsiW